MTFLTGSWGGGGGVVGDAKPYFTDRMSSVIFSKKLLSQWQLTKHVHNIVHTLMPNKLEERNIYE